MSYKKDIFESLMPNDLEDLVLPVISIDEYISKIDKDATVLAFYCIEEDPATDLASFLEFGPIDVIDVEVSPAPDENGRYLVFVEVNASNLDELANITYKILNNIKHLTSISNWVFINKYGKGTIKTKE